MFDKKKDKKKNKDKKKKTGSDIRIPKIDLNTTEKKTGGTSKKGTGRARPKTGKTKDPRLDELVPLFVDIIGKLLAAKGMLRYRDDFIEEVKEIMEAKDGKKKR